MLLLIRSHYMHAPYSEITWTINHVIKLNPVFRGKQNGPGMAFLMLNFSFLNDNCLYWQVVNEVTMVFIILTQSDRETYSNTETRGWARGLHTAPMEQLIEPFPGGGPSLVAVISQDILTEGKASLMVELTVSVLKMQVRVPETHWLLTMCPF